MPRDVAMADRLLRVDHRLTAASASRTSRLRGVRRVHLIGWLFVAPALFMYGAFVLLPLALTFQYSFYRWDGIGPSEWVGLRDYVNVLTDPDLVGVILNAFRLIFFFSFLPVGLGLIVAAVMRRIATGRFGTASRTVLFLPQIIPLVAAGIAWKWVLSTSGVVNQVLTAIGLGDITRAWLGDFDTALPAVGLIGAWVLIGLCTILLLTGMSKIDHAPEPPAGDRRVHHGHGDRRPGELRHRVHRDRRRTWRVDGRAWPRDLPARLRGEAGRPGVGAGSGPVRSRPRMRASDPAARARGRLMIVARREMLTGRLLLLLLVGITLLPFLSLLSAALAPSDSTPLGIEWPSAPQWSNFIDAFNVAQMPALLWSSILIVLGVVPVAVIISTMAGFAIGHLRIIGGRWLFLLFLIGLTLPFEGIITPLYYLAQGLGILNTKWAIILPLIGLYMPFAVFWMRAHFINMPTELSEAARVDGATTWDLFWRIHVPLARPALSALAILLSVWTWNQFLLALVLVEDPLQRTMAGALGAYQGHYATNIPLLCAGSLLILTPTLIVFLLFQRQFISALLQGSLKG